MLLAARCGRRLVRWPTTVRRQSTGSTTDEVDKRLAADQSLLSRLCSGRLQASELEAAVPVVVARVSRLSFSDCARVLATYHAAERPLPDSAARLLLYQLLEREQAAPGCFEAVLSDAALLAPVVATMRQLQLGHTGLAARLLVRLDDSPSLSPDLRRQLAELMPERDRPLPAVADADFVGDWTTRATPAVDAHLDAGHRARLTSTRSGRVVVANWSLLPDRHRCLQLQPSQPVSVLFTDFASDDQLPLTFSVLEWRRLFKRTTKSTMQSTIN